MSTAGPVVLPQVAADANPAARDGVPLRERERPIIGVTGPDAGGGAAWWFTRLAVWLAGGHAVRITPMHPRRIDGLDGLIVGGGADVDPLLYGQADAPPVHPPREPDESVLLYVLEWVVWPLTWLARKLAARLAPHSGRDAARDGLEMRLLDDAVRRGLPVLGICRGEQLLNVYFGGTLHRDLEGFYVEDPEVRTILPRKRLVLADGSNLRRVIRDRAPRVNALHRHAIDRLGGGLRVAARDRNGIVQAIEHEALPFVVGVQWHPEYLPQRSEQRALFERLVEEAKRAADPDARHRSKMARAAPQQKPGANEADQAHRARLRE